MNKKQLSEAIEEGMTNSYINVLKGFCGAGLGILTLLIIILIFSNLYTNYQNDKCSKENNCIQQTISMESIDRCNLDRINCDIIQYNKNLDKIILKQESLCGWQEANEWFNNVKEFTIYNYNNNLTMECN